MTDTAMPLSRNKLRKIRLILIVFPLALILLVFITLVFQGIPVGFWNFWKFLTPETIIGIIIGDIVINFIVLVIDDVREKRRERHLVEKIRKFIELPKQKRPYDIILLPEDSEELRIEIGKRAGVQSAIDEKVEPYVPREALKAKTRGTRPYRFLIYGPSGVGKTRETIEIIEKLKPRIRILYFYQWDITPPEVPFIEYRNVSLFIDDLLPLKGSQYGEDEWAPTPSQRLQSIIDLFDRTGQKVDVIITVRTENYKNIRRELSDVLTEEGFIEIELRGFSLSERESYIRRCAEKLRLDIEDACVKYMAEKSGESLNDIYLFLRTKRKEGFAHIDMKVVRDKFDEYIRSSREERCERLKLSSDEKIVLNALSMLRQFSIKPFIYLMRTCFVYIKGHSFFVFRWFDKLKFSLVIRSLKKSLFDIDKKENIIYFSDEYITLRDAKGAIRDYYPLVSKVIDQVYKERTIFRKPKHGDDLYLLLRKFTEALHKYGAYEESNKFNDYIFDLPNDVLENQGLNPKKVRSKIMFHKGYNYYLLGKGYWEKAEICYLESIKLDELNLFAKHALATLSHKRGKSTKALELLDEITEADKKDLLAYKTKLDILIDTDLFDLDKAEQTRKKIEILLKSVSFPPKLTISTKLTLVRFLAKRGELMRDEETLKEEENYFDKVVIPQFESLIEEIPPEEPELRAIVCNVYGCFLCDVLGRKEDGKFQLEEKALKSWPEHLQSLHKLITIYMEMADETFNKKERKFYRKKAKEHIKRMLEINESHYPTLLSKAILEGKTIDWGRLSKSVFWEKALEIYKMYQEALEEDSHDYPSYHNPIVHHAAGCFLWHIEAKAYKRGILENNPSLIPSADTEFLMSPEIEKHFKETETIPSIIRSHLILSYFTLGSYLITIARRNNAILRKGHEKLRKSIELSKTKGQFKFYSQNSYAESYVGKILLEISEKNEAKRLLESAVKRFAKNWRAWWWLGSIRESDEEFHEAFEDFYRSADGQNSAMLLGWLRSIVQSWIDNKYIPREEGLDLKIKCSSKAYEIDPNGDLNPKNISDYGFDLYQKGEVKRDRNVLEEAVSLLLLAHKKYIEKGFLKEAGFSLWYAGECQQIIRFGILGRVDRETLEYFIESAKLEGSSEGFDNLFHKITIYCSPIWRAGQKLDADLVTKIEDCAKLYPEYRITNKMVGYVLARNKECSRALPYLEKIRASKDTYVLRSLLECYYAKGERDKAEEIYQELYPLLGVQERGKLKERALRWGLRCP